MFRIQGMSKISTLKYKNQMIDIWVREKKGKHLAPYIVAVLPNGNEVHIQIKNRKIHDNTGVSTDIIKYILKWVLLHQDELLESWEAAKKGKAITVPGTLPKTTKSFKVRRVKEIKTSKRLLMLIRFENDEIRLIDFRKIIPENPAFKPLLKPSIFMTAEADYLASGVRWDAIDIDMEAAALYDDSEAVDLTYFKI
jgi:hypothetical protein